MGTDNDYFGENKYKNAAIKAAKELGYGEEVVEKIKAAKSDSDVGRIMITARKYHTNKDI